MTPTEAAIFIASTPERKWAYMLAIPPEFLSGRDSNNGKCIPQSFYIGWAERRKRQEAEAAGTLTINPGVAIPAQWDGDVSQCAVSMGPVIALAATLAREGAFGHIERKRAPLAYFTERTPFNSFDGFAVVSSTQEQQPAAKHWTSVGNDTPAALSVIKAL